MPLIVRFQLKTYLTLHLFLSRISFFILRHITLFHSLSVLLHTFLSSIFGLINHTYYILVNHMFFLYIINVCNSVYHKSGYSFLFSLFFLSSISYTNIFVNFKWNDHNISWLLRHGHIEAYLKAKMKKIQRKNTEKLIPTI